MTIGTMRTGMTIEMMIGTMRIILLMVLYVMVNRTTTRENW